jgi:dipeptidyl aminopeptidase/acylaminoacyl peptidase
VSENTPAARRGLTLDDLARIRVPNEPTISPDGRLIVFTLSRMDRKADTYYSNLWLVPADGSSEARQLTAGDNKDRAPAWSPDGTRLVFASNRGGASNLWIMRADGGEALKLTDLKGEVDEPAWSPDGRSVAFTFRKEDPALESEPDATQVPGSGEPIVTAPESKQPKKPPRYRHITRLHYKEDGKGFLPKEWQHIWVIPVDGLTGGTPRQLTDGDADDREPTWSPDGRWIAFLAKRQPDAEWYEAWTDIFRVRAAGGAIEQLSREPGERAALAYTPDGTQIGYTGHLNPNDGGGMTNMHVRAIPAAGGDARDLTPEFDRSAQNVHINDVNPGWNGRVAWSADGGTAYFLVCDRGAVRVYAVAASGGAPTPLTGERELVYDFTASTDARRLACAIGDPATPGDIYALDPASGARTRLTQMNKWIADEIELATPEEFEVQGGGGRVHAWRVRPPACVGVNGEAKLPAILHIHGGPHGMYGWGFYHEFQMLAARGFVVVWSNPRGGQGYGQAWAESIKGAWGGVDYEDLMAVADEMTRWPFVDVARMGVGGGSYGGYMTNWIVGHTERFRAAVTMRSISNLHSDSGTSDYGYFDAWYWGAHTWEDPQKFLRHSPITYVTQIRTPLLILHCEEDHRCPIEQAEQLYTALRYMKREVEFVRYPEESHGLTRGGTPSRRLDHQRRTRDWFEKHLGPMPTAGAVRVEEAVPVGAPGAKR